jgi:hypothetical protein
VEAIQEGRRGVELLPEAKDVMNGVHTRRHLGMIYAGDGKRRRARGTERGKQTPRDTSAMAASSSIRNGTRSAAIRASTKSLIHSLLNDRHLSTTPEP